MTKKTIISYNLNGIRAACNKGFSNWLAEHPFDIVCIQETKAQPEQIPVEIFEDLGYQVFCFSAQKKGYSGVAVLTKDTPLQVLTGMGLEQYDSEGRLIRLDFPDFTLINAYHPAGVSGEERQQFKMRWLDDFHSYILKLREEKPRLVLAGDYNICHTAIDIHDPIRNANSSGFLPEERDWMEQFLNSGFIDSFRHLHPGQPHNYTWWSYRTNARARNLGWRLDYLMLTPDLLPHLKSSFILTDAVHSDHCPTGMELEF